MLVTKEQERTKDEHRRYFFTQNSKRNLSAEEWNKIINQINQINFWTLPPTIERQGLDGGT